MAAPNRPPSAIATPATAQEPIRSDSLRQVHVAWLVVELEQFLRQQYGRLSRKGDLAKAINFMLARWNSFARFVSDGRICMTNNAAERRVRTVAVKRRNWTFCGSDRAAACIR
ncbi:IS66 family transposase [Sphingomonas sp. CFBP 13728]|uniref:IS66 family transposase n=1 Tax=Sphingomonas sp. CFBP 13728 TaxID=2775294 RepID=UPI001FD19C5D|nr:IS66 family transposase [Sphingomonas sp. CFBP 13728]